MEFVIIRFQKIEDIYHWDCSYFSKNLHRRSIVVYLSLFSNLPENKLYIFFLFLKNVLIFRYQNFFYYFEMAGLLHNSCLKICDRPCEKDKLV